jgi:hypothetical protein
MKKLFLLLALMGSAVSALGQGGAAPKGDVYVVELQ